MLDFSDFSREDMSDLLERILLNLLMKLQIFHSRIWLRILWKERDLALAFDRCHAVPQAVPVLSSKGPKSRPGVDDPEHVSFARPEEPEETAEAGNGNFEVSLCLFAEIIWNRKKLSAFACFLSNVWFIFHHFSSVFLGETHQYFTILFIDVSGDFHHGPFPKHWTFSAAMPQKPLSSSWGRKHAKVEHIDLGWFHSLVVFHNYVFYMLNVMDIDISWVHIIFATGQTQMPVFARHPRGWWHTRSA